MTEKQWLEDIDIIRTRTMSIWLTPRWIRMMPVFLNPHSCILNYSAFVQQTDCRRSACSSLVNRSDGPETDISSAQHQMASPAVCIFFFRNSLLSNVFVTSGVVSQPKGRSWIVDVWEQDAELNTWPKKDGKIQKRRQRERRPDI
jgi:hypothetical protein